MSGYCPDCGNTMCLCDQETKATYPFRTKALELEQTVILHEQRISDLVGEKWALESRLAESEAKNEVIKKNFPVVQDGIGKICEKLAVAVELIELVFEHGSVDSSHAAKAAELWEQIKPIK